METIKITGARLLNEEREVHLYFDPTERVWILDAFMPKYFRKALKQGWMPIREYVYGDGTVCGMSFTAPERCISFRNIEKKKLSDKQMINLCSEDE